MPYILKLAVINIDLDRPCSTCDHRCARPARVVATSNNAVHLLAGNII